MLSNRKAIVNRDLDAVTEWKPYGVSTRVVCLWSSSKSDGKPKISGDRLQTGQDGSGIVEAPIIERFLPC